MAMVFTVVARKQNQPHLSCLMYRKEIIRLQKPVMNLQKEVYRETDGRVNIEVYHDTLGAETRPDGAGTRGWVLILQDYPDLFQNYVEDMKAFQSLSLYNSEDDMWKVLDGSVGNDLLNAKGLTDNDMVGLCWFSGGSRNFYNNKKSEITKRSGWIDITCKYRSDDQLVSMNGGTPVNIAYNDIYNAIKKARSTAQRITGHLIYQQSIIRSQNISRLINIPASEMIVASQKALEKMSSQDQETVKKVAKEISKEQRQAFKDFDKRRSSRLRKLDAR